MIREQFEKYLWALGCVSGGIGPDGMFSVRDVISLETYALVGTEEVGHIYFVENITNMEDPIRRKALEYTLKQYTDTNLMER